jgi:hypothetical protein
MIRKHVTHFANAIGLEDHEIEAPEHAEHTLKQLISAQVTLCDWAQVCSYVTPGQVDAIRFNAQGSLDDWGRSNVADPAFFAALAQEATFPPEHQARAMSPTFSNFWNQVCPTASIGQAMVLFHALNVPNMGAVSAAIAAGLGSTGLGPSGLGAKKAAAALNSAMQTYRDKRLKGDDPTELAREIGLLWNATSFPEHMFSPLGTEPPCSGGYPASQGPGGRDPVNASVGRCPASGPQGTIWGADTASPVEEPKLDSYLMHYTPVGSAVGSGPSPSSGGVHRMEPVLCAYRAAAQVPAVFPVNKLLAQIIASPAQCPPSVFAKTQTPQSAQRALDKLFAQADAGTNVASLVATAHREIPALCAAVLATDQSQQLYNRLCERCGAQWVRDNVDAPTLTAWLTQAHLGLPLGSLGPKGSGPVGKDSTAAGPEGAAAAAPVGKGPARAVAEYLAMEPDMPVQAILAGLVTK